MTAQSTTDYRTFVDPRRESDSASDASDAVVVLEDVHKSYPITGNFRDALKFWRRKRNYALKGTNLVVERGIAQGLLGANGAGKTTLLKLLAGLLLPNEGRVIVDGLDSTNEFGRIKQKLIYVSSDERQHYWRLTGRQNLEFYGRLYEVPPNRLADRINELLELVGIADSADEMVIRFSTGMRQRLAIARGLIAEPRIMLLDEPTRSLDPPSARGIWRFVKEELMERQGVTVLIATHDMEEAAYLCDRVAVIHDGKVAINDTVEAVTDRFGSEHRVTVTLANSTPSISDRIRLIDGVADLHLLPGQTEDRMVIDFGVDDPDLRIPGIVSMLASEGCHVHEVVRRRSALGDVIASLAEAGT